MSINGIFDNIKKLLFIDLRNNDGRTILCIFKLSYFLMRYAEISYFKPML